MPRHDQLPETVPAESTKLLPAKAHGAAKKDAPRRAVAPAPPVVHAARAAFDAREARKVDGVELSAPPVVKHRRREIAERGAPPKQRHPHQPPTS